MERSARRIDKSRDFFLAQNRRKAKCSFGLGRLGNTPGLFESIGIEKSQSGEIPGNTAWRQLPLLKQFGLVFANVSWPQTVRWTVEASSKIFNCPDVRTCGMLRVVTTLEFLQHHFS